MFVKQVFSELFIFFLPSSAFFRCVVNVWLVSLAPELIPRVTDGPLRLNATIFKNSFHFIGKRWRVEWRVWAPHGGCLAGTSLLYGGRHWHSWHRRTDTHWDRQTDRQTWEDSFSSFFGAARRHIMNCYSLPSDDRMWKASLLAFLSLCVEITWFLPRLCSQLLVTLLSKAPLFDAVCYAWANDTDELNWREKKKKTESKMKDIYCWRQWGHC